MEIISLTQLRARSHRAYAKLRAKMPKGSTVVVGVLGTDTVALLRHRGIDVRFQFNGTTWTVVPQPSMTLKTYATRVGISRGEAYRQWRRGEFKGAFVARGLVTVPVQVLNDSW